LNVLVSVLATAAILFGARHLFERWPRDCPWAVPVPARSMRGLIA